MGKRLKNLIRITASIVISVPFACLLLWQGLVGALHHGPGIVVGFFLAGVLSLVAVITAHECGHALAALLVRFRIVQIRIGPLQLVRKNGRLRPRLNWSLNRPAAFVQTTPNHERHLRRRCALYVSGGILANAVLGGACLLSAEWINRATPPPDSPPAAAKLPALLMPRNPDIAWLNMVALWSVAVALENLVPGQKRGYATDGTKLWDLVRGGPWAERRLLLLTFAGALLRGERPRALKPDLIERLLVLRDGSSYDVEANLFAYYHFLDAGQVERAGQFMDLFTAPQAACPAGHRHLLFVEAAYLVGYHRRDASQARQWLDKSAGGEIEKQTRLRAEAAVLLAEGRFEEAAAAARQGLEAVPQSADPGGAIAEAEWLEDLLNAAKSSSRRLCANPDSAVTAP